MIQGRNILIYEGDVVIAAAKSCTINNNAEALENSSPASGTARSYTVGRTGWDISISTLVLGMKDHLLKVGQAYRLVWKVRGNDSDAMQGTAICTNAQVEATVGNLAQGSFQFLGSDDNGTIVTPPTPTPSDYVTEQDVVNIINQYDFTTEQWVQNYAGIANGMITIGHNSISPVTSVAMTVPTGFSVSGSPISKTGTLALAYATGYEGFTTALKEKIEALYSWFEVDADGDVKTKDTAGGHVRGLYSESFVSSLGKNSSSGGGGVDLTAVWASLTNTDSPTYSETLKININHIPNIGWSKIDNKPTTLAGYGITDAKIASGTITLGSNTITPLTASSSLAWGKLTGTPTTLAGYGIGDAKIANGVITLGSSTITPVTSVAMTVPTGFSVSGSPISKTGTLALAYATGYEGFTTALKEKIEALYSWFEVDAAGDIKTKDMPNGTHRGFYTESFVSALGANSQGGGSSTFDEPQMWTALQSTTGTYATTKIATSHIPDMASTYGYLKSSALNGYATQSWVNQQGFLTTHQSIYALTLKAGGTAVTTFTPNSADASLDFVAGTNISLTRGTNQITIANTYSYTLPLAASGTRGGVQIGYLESNSGTSTTRNYAVKLSSEKMYVNVPWTDTTYKLTLNGTTNGASGGTSLGSFYAPTASGTANQVLISGGSNTAPSWTAQSNLSVGTAAKLNTGTTTYSAWGQTYWSSGVPQSISGNMTSVGSITPSANGNALGTTSARFNIFGYAGNFSGNVSITGTLGVTGATTLSSTLSVAGGITLTTTKRIYFGDTSHYLELDSTGFHFSHGIYSDSFVSALGANSSGGGGGVDLTAVWASLTNTENPTYSTTLKINANHIPNLNANKITEGTLAAARIPIATASAVGGIKVGTTLAISDGVLNQKSGVATAGTYRSVTVDTYGRVTAGTNPTTLSGYGITDAYTKTQVDNALSGYLPLSGGTLTGAGLTIATGADNKLIINNTDTETKYSLISFQQNGTEYGTLGTLGTDNLTWNGYGIINTNNIGSYAPSLSGTGASGTWGISISGNAATATSTEYLYYYQVSDPNTAYKDHVVKWFSQISGNSGYAGTNYGFPVSSNANGILWLGTHNGNYGGQIGISSNGNIYYRYTSSGNFSTAANGGSWHTILHSNNTYVSSGKGYINGTEITTISGNAATATKATQDGDGRTITSTYLPLSGGTMSGTLKWISAALPQTTSPNYLLTIDSFADGGTTKWALLSNVLVGKATTLATPRTIWGQSFDGSSNVSGALTGVTTIHMTNNLTLAAGSDGIYLSNNGIRLHNSSNTYKTDALTFDLDNGNATFHHALAVNYASFYPFAIRRFESSTEQLEISVLDVSVKFNASDADGWSNFLFCSNGTEFVRFNGNNKCVGIGTNAPSQKLHVSGNILASGEVTASSDERKKNIISNTKFNVKDIASARSILYEWNDGRDKDNEKKIHGGSIAQDWLGKADSFLSQDNDGWYSINYGALALCSAITIAREVLEHEDRITLLEKENARLKARVEELEERRVA